MPKNTDREQVTRDLMEGAKIGGLQQYEQRPSPMAPVPLAGAPIGLAKAPGEDNSNFPQD